MKKYLLIASAILLFGSSVASSSILYGIEAHVGTTDDKLLIIDTDTGSDTIIGSTGLRGPSLVLDQNSGVLYASALSPTTVQSSLYTINPSTGESTFLGLIGFGYVVAGLAFDSNNDILYGVANLSGNDALIKINTATGADTLIGIISGFENVEGLAFDHNTGTLYGLDGFQGLITIDTTTGGGTLIGHHGFNTGGGLAFDPVANKLYSVENGRRDSLYEIDPLTGQGIAIPGNFNSQLVSGLTFVRSASVTNPVTIPATVFLMLIGLISMTKIVRQI